MSGDPAGVLCRLQALMWGPHEKAFPGDDAPGCPGAAVKNIIDNIKGGENMSQFKIILRYMKKK